MFIISSINIIMVYKSQVNFYLCCPISQIWILFQDADRKKIRQMVFNFKYLLL